VAWTVLSSPVSLLAGEAPEPPVLIVRAPEELDAVAQEIRRLGATELERPLELTGLADPEGPIVVVLAPAGSEAERTAPSWIAGWADGRSGLVVLLPSRIDRYPDRGLAPILRHEITHVLVARAARGREVPRWFDEGLAMAAGREWGLGDRARLALAVLTDDTLPIARLDRAFAGGESEVEAAYALAGDFVRAMLDRFGEEIGGELLRRLAEGERFKPAFLGATGVRLAEFERDYWSQRTLWDRWIPILSSSALLWAGVSLLVLAAARRKRRRAALLAELWDLEEAAARAAREDDGPRPN